MTAAQTRLAGHIDAFYGASDRNSESAMAAHSYKRAVDDLDAGIGRELVSYTCVTSGMGFEVYEGCAISRYYP